MKFELDFIVKATQGKLISSPHQAFVGYTCDNREPDLQHKIFIPLVGENHDAHQYVEKAVQAGVTGVLFHQWDAQWEPLKERVSFIQVDDTLVALQQWAKAWRQTFKGRVLGLTGSNGKTTTKDFLYQIIKPLASVHSSQGSYNNHWGVPFTLLDSDPKSDYVIVEMGMNHGGEILELVKIAEPDLVTVTNVGRAHIGNFSNGVEGIASAKEEIYVGAKPAAKLLFNIDNDWTRQMYQKYMDRETYTYSTKNFSADVYFKVKNKTKKGFLIEGQIGGVLGQAEVCFWGEHNVQNLCAAVALAYIGGVRPEKLWPVLEQTHSGWGRNQWIKTQSGAEILFDGYNANPDSFAQLLSNTEDIVKNNPALAIFGEMLELGEDTQKEHESLGERAGRLPWSKAIFIGPSGKAFERGWKASGNKNNPIILSTYKESLDLDLSSMVDNQSFIIVKGSRGGALERIVERFEPLGFTRK
jgi:UDP-N-acetylmuramoyl-tripeptide--D-alanyl-D-alanine ligase